MSPNITWKGDGPLMVGGLVGGSDKCCCENPPPPYCWCPDYCQYRIEVTSPDELNVSSNYDCYGSLNKSYTEPSLIQSVLDPFPGVIDCPGEVSGAGSPPCGNFSSAQMSNASMQSVGLYAVAYSVIAKRQSVGSFAGAVADVAYEARVFCLLPETTGAEKPQIFLQLDLRARVSNNDPILGEIFFYARSARKTVRIDNDNCEADGNRMCLYLGDKYNRRIANFPTPLTFTTSMATTSFGDYDDDVLSGREYGPYGGVLGSLVDAGFEATFRITSRPTCFPTTACSCSASLAGTTWNFFGQDFQYGTESDVWDDNGFNRIYFSGDGTVYREEYDPLGPVDGLGHGSRLLSRKQIDIYCDYVDGEPTWVALLRSMCSGYDQDGVQTHYAEDTWIGSMLCYEACADEHRSEGDPIPTGGPESVVYIGRENFIYEDCSPGSYPSVSISQTATC